MTDEGGAWPHRRVLLGGFAVVGAILGFAGTQLVVDAAALPEVWILLALPAFGVVGVAGFVLFVSPFLTAP